MSKNQHVFLEYILPDPTIDEWPHSGYYGRVIPELREANQMVKQQGTSLEKLLRVRRRMTLGYVVGYGAYWGAAVVKDLTDNASHSSRWSLLYYGLMILFVIGLVIALTGLRYIGELNNNSEFRAIIKSERNTLIAYKSAAVGFCAVAIGAVIVRFCPSFSMSNATLGDSLMFICLISAGGAYVVFDGV